jgi:hypothetical protein
LRCQFSGPKALAKKGQKRPVSLSASGLRHCAMCRGKGFVLIGGVLEGLYERFAV